MILDDSDEEQFEVGADGKIRLKGGKKKINLDKLTDEDLRRLGIDPTLSKAEIARKLKVGSQRGFYKLSINRKSLRQRLPENSRLAHKECCNKSMLNYQICSTINLVF